MKEALYTKYRPKKFKEVLGQDQVVKVLEEAIKVGNISHAYIFSGTRGIGKTSIARLLAREIGTNPSDLYEIDAASNNGVDHIRELNESVNTLPFDSKYKVYILDEVHMLSKGAFNALLKTLEEPPQHVVFILATTEPEKIPDTVISRCETYYFKKPNQKILRDMVLAVAKKEGFELSKNSADLIALLGDGSFRDTLGVLQKVISSSGDMKLSDEEVERVTGAPKTSIVNQMIEAIVLSDIERGLEAISYATDQNIDMKVYTTLVLMKLRAMLLLKFVKGYEKKLENTFSEEDISFLNDLLEKEGVKINSDTLVRFLKAYEEISKSHIPQLPLELALIDICA